MDLILYRDVRLNILQSIAWEREPLMDQAGGTTYECTRVRGQVVVTYNPGAISYKLRNGFPDNVGAQTAGKFPAETDQEIRRYLEQPRGLLKVYSGDELWLESPSGNYTCDVRNGPFVKVNSIVKIPGERLWQINLSFETYINEMVGAARSDPPLIISNRWYAHDDTNWQHLRTRTYQGTCVVRGDVLQAQQGTNKFIDSLRSSFCAFSIQPGFQRESVKVTVNPDGNTAHYTVVDTEQLFSKDRLCPAVRIKVTDSAFLWQGSMARYFENAGGITGIALQGAAAAASAANGNWSAVGNMAQGAIQNFNSQLPKAYKSIIVDCWGNQRTKRQLLVQYALAVATARMGTNSIFSNITSEFILSQDTENFVRLINTVRWGIDAAIALFGPLNGQILNEVFDNNPQTLAQQAFASAVGQDPNTNAGGFRLTQSQLLTNPQFPADSQTRGTAATAPSSIALQTLLTQTLEGFNEAPAAVP